MTKQRKTITRRNVVARVPHLKEPQCVLECNVHPGIQNPTELRDEIAPVMGGLYEGDRVTVYEVLETGHMEFTRFCEGRQEVFRVDSRTERVIGLHVYKRGQLVPA